MWVYHCGLCLRLVTAAAAAVYFKTADRGVILHNCFFFWVPPGTSVIAFNIVLKSSKHQPMDYRAIIINQNGSSYDVQYSNGESIHNLDEKYIFFPGMTFIIINIRAFFFVFLSVEILLMDPLPFRPFFEKNKGGLCPFFFSITKTFVKLRGGEFFHKSFFEFSLKFLKKCPRTRSAVFRNIWGLSEFVRSTADILLGRFSKKF